MKKISSDPQRLSAYLAEARNRTDVTTLGEFDGLVSGVALCPVAIRPSVWLGAVWGGRRPTFRSEREAHEIVGLMTGHHRDRVGALDAGELRDPMIEPGDVGDLSWRGWARGFAKAVALRPEAWGVLALLEDPAALRAVEFLRDLGDGADRPEIGRSDERETVDRVVSSLIPAAVRTLGAARRALAEPPPARDAPCPCGSARTFAKCCLH